ncbi:iron uptake protein [Sorangium cellulosum]|uniref:Iron uptake protein n=1 Tax=Sorangium cellulosum TaxID=56 RepID=A0A2L0F9D3_SORCE|nr:PepSY-associated TM helix domain-containing protein [Sorangium cellulosum]AUX48184.1 iron uptake protein [Sorangium cellulosum]
MAKKLSRHAFTTFWDVHAFTGVIGGLLLYVMFLSGGITLFRRQLAVWEEPLTQQRSTVEQVGLQATLDRGLAAAGATPDELWFYLPHDGLGAARLFYSSQGTRVSSWVHDGLVPERERLSDFLFDLHYLWHAATGMGLFYLGGLLCVALLLALATGVLIHLKDIVRQFHQFRPDKSRRVLWSDMHKVLGVMGLPFQVMYAYTGAFFVFLGAVVQVFTGPAFGGDAARADRAAWGASYVQEPAPGVPARGLTLDELAARARAAEPRLVPEMARIRHPGLDSGTVDIRGSVEGVPFGRGLVRLRATDGAVLSLDAPGAEGARGSVIRWIYGLHRAEFGGVVLRFLFFLLGVATCATILTGNWIWLARREARRGSLGNRLLARLTVGVGAGTLVAIAALFLASRALPLDWSGRMAAEELTFVAALGLCVAWSLAARDGGSLWWRQLGLAGLLLLPVPALAARWSGAGLFGAGQKIAAVVAVDVGLLVAAAALCASAWALRRAALRRAAQQAAPPEEAAAVDQGGEGLMPEGRPAYARSGGSLG